MAIAGAFAPVPTPLNRDGKFHPPTLRAHMAWLAAQGLDGALILGTNGEFAGMAMNERLHVARKAAEARPPGFSLLLNVSSCALPEALKLAALGWPLRYQAILLAPPWYYRNASVTGLAAFIRAVLDASRLPVILYHIPQLTGVPFGDALLDAIGQHKNLAGVKDSTGDEAELKRLSARFAAGSYLVGNDKLVAACHAAGGKGSITACASVVPDLVAAIRHDPGQQGKLNSVRALLEKFGLAAAVKAVLRRQGIGEYASRPPMEDMAEDDSAQMFIMLDALGALADGARAAK